MKVLWTLIKKDFMLDYGYFANPVAALKNKKLRTQILLFPVLLLIFGFYAVIIARVIFGAYDNIAALGLSEMLLAFSFFLLSIITVIFGIAPLVSRIYFSNDILILQRLPVSYSSIYWSKIINTTLNCLIGAIFLTIPMVIKYGTYYKRGILYFLTAAIGIISCVMITVSLMSLIVVVVMSFINKLPKVKGILQFASLAMVIALNMVIQFFVNKTTGNMKLTDIAKIGDAVSARMYMFFPHVKPITMALTADTVPMAILYSTGLIVLSIAVTAGCVALGVKFLVKGVNSNKVVAKVRAGSSRSSYDRKSVVYALAQREAKEIFKSPIYLMNIALIGLLMPLFMVIPMMAQGGVDMQTILQLGEMIGTLGLSTSTKFGIAAVVGLYISIFLSIIGQSGITSISREGKRIWLPQTLPISYRDQLRGRLLCSHFFQTISVLPIFLLLVFLFRAEPILLVGYAAGTVAAVLFTANLGLMIDILKPKLIWDNPQQAVKQNFGVFIATMGSMLYVGLSGFLVFKAASKGILDMDNIFYLAVALLVVHLVIAYIINRRELKVFSRKIKTYSAQL